MISKKFRLQNSHDFDTIYKKGTKLRGEYGMLIVLKPLPSTDSNAKTETPKIGFVVSKKMGNAVERHNLTRQLRSISYEFLMKFEKQLPGYKFSYIAYLKPLSYKILEEDLMKLFNQTVKS